MSGKAIRGDADDEIWNAAVDAAERERENSVGGEKSPCTNGAVRLIFTFFSLQNPVLALTSSAISAPGVRSGSFRAAEESLNALARESAKGTKETSTCAGPIT